MRSMWNVVSTS